MDREPCICLFSALYRPSLGGVETYTANLADALRRQGLRVIVATQGTAGPSGISEENGIEVVRLPCRPLLGGRWPLPKGGTEARKLWAWLEEQPIDYLTVNTRFYPHSIAGLAFAQRKGLAAVVVEHGSAHLTLGNAPMDAAVQLIEHALTSYGKQFRPRYYAVSRKASAWLEHFGIASCGELSNSIDADAYCKQASGRDFRKEFNVPDGALLVAFAGRLVKEKGVLQLAQAANAGRGERHPLAVVAAGAGPLEANLKALEGPTFHLAGRLNGADMAALLAQADALCLPSRSEGFSTALLEAAACGTPAIATDVGGMDELIPDSSFGTVIPDAEPPTILEALRNAAENRDRLHAQGENVAELVRREYSWDRTAAKTLEACRRAQLAAQDA